MIKVVLNNEEVIEGKLINTSLPLCKDVDFPKCRNADVLEEVRMLNNVFRFLLLDVADSESNNAAYRGKVISINPRKIMTIY